MSFELNASMMCANFGNLEKKVKDLGAGEIDSFHIDIMDGCYVQNFNGWLVNTIDIQNRIDIHQKVNEEIDFE